MLRPYPRSYEQCPNVVHSGLVHLSKSNAEQTQEWEIVQKPAFLGFLLVSCPTREQQTLRLASQHGDTTEEKACLGVENSYIFLLSQFCAEAV